jgi:hypothetical protein
VNLRQAPAYVSGKSLEDWIVASMEVSLEICFLANASSDLDILPHGSEVKLTSMRG